MPTAPASFAREALATLLPLERAPGAEAALAALAPWLDARAELALAAGRREVGIVTRGDGPAFTAAAATALGALGVSDDDLAHHQALAAWFEHTGGLVKLEWALPTESASATATAAPAAATAAATVAATATATAAPAAATAAATVAAAATAAAPRAACYFRRRPPLDEVARRLAAHGLGPAAVAHLRATAAELGKTTVHFVAAAFAPARPRRHKLYLTRHVTPATGDEVGAALDRLVATSGVAADVRARWRAAHDAHVAARADTTVYVSLAAAGDGVVPGLKLDYADVAAEAAGAWAGDDAPTAVADAAWLCALVGRPRLGYLGLRLAPAAPAAIKLYAAPP